MDNGNTASYVYNALGQRVEKIGGGQTIYYYHDASGNIAMNEITSLGQTHVHEYYFPTVAGRNFAKYYWTGSAWETDYLHANPLDSSQLVTRSDNILLEAEVFFPFGGKRWRGGGTQDVRFAGMQERDMETENWQDPLDPTPNRMYTSGLGRWLTPDPAGLNAVDLADPQTWNMYAYARNNPATMGDPSGLLAIAMAEYEVGTGLIASEEEAGEREDLLEEEGKGQEQPQDKQEAELVLVQTSDTTIEPPDPKKGVPERDIVYTVETKNGDTFTRDTSEKHTVSGEEKLDPHSNDRPALLDPNHKEKSAYKDAIWVTGQGKSFKTTQHWFIDGKRATVYENRRDANGHLISGRTVHIEATDKRVNMTLEPD